MLKKFSILLLILLVFTSSVFAQGGKDLKVRNLYVSGQWAQFKSYTEVMVYGNLYDALRVDYIGSGHNIFNFQADGVSVMKLTKSGILTLVGTFSLTSLGLNDTDASNTLSLVWNENDSSDRTLNFLVGGVDRSITLEGDVTLDQDYSSDASPAFAGLTLNGAAFPLDDFIKANDFKPAGGAGNIVPTIRPDRTNNKMYNRSESKEDTQSIVWCTQYQLPQLASGITTAKIRVRASDFTNCAVTWVWEDQDGNADATGSVTITPSGNDVWQEFTYTFTSAYTSLEDVWSEVTISSLDLGDTADFSGMDIVYP